MTWFDNLVQDIRYAVRGIFQQPGFALGVILTISLGIGANAVIFSLVDRLLFRPPARMRDPASVNQVYYRQNILGKDLTSADMSFPLYQDFRDHTTAFSQVAGFWSGKVAVGTGDLAHELPVAAVSASFFDFFDAPPIVGRYFFSAEDSLPEGQHVAVLSHGMWKAEMGGRRDVLGSTIQIGAVQYSIIGVAPPGFNGLWPDQPPAAFIPLTVYGANDQFGFNAMMRSRWSTSYSWNWMELMVRRKPDVTIAAASSDLSNALMIGVRAMNAENPRMGVRVSDAMAASILKERGPNASDTSKVGFWLIGVAVIVLLIATANVANLFLARALRRRREVAVRLALGVSRRRLATQILLESVLLALSGGVVGILCAQWGGAALRSTLLPNTENLSTWRDARGLLVVGVAVVLAGMLTGLASVWQANRTDLTVDLKTGARDGTAPRSRARAALLVLQAALSVILLIGAGLFVRSVDQVRHVRLGYDVDPILWADLNMRGVKLDSAGQADLRRRLIETARSLPEVADATRQLTAPFWGRLVTVLHVDGIDSVAKRGVFYFNAVSPEYFSTMGMRIVRGRPFTGADRPPLGATVVSEGMANALWPNEDALTKCLRLRTADSPCIPVVGIAENIKFTQLDQDPGLNYYIPSDMFAPFGGLMIRVRGSGDAARVMQTVRRGLQRVMPGNSYVTIRPFAEIVGEQTRSWRLGAAVFLAFGLLALLVAAIGLYSVAGYDVTQRAKEFGVRVALGARTEDITRLVIGQGLRYVLIGIALGAAVALLAASRIQPLLFKQSARDPLVFGVVVFVLMMVALVATMVPARRAALVDPNSALKAD